MRNPESRTPQVDRATSDAVEKVGDVEVSIKASGSKIELPSSSSERSESEGRCEITDPSKVSTEKSDILAPKRKRGKRRKINRADVKSVGANERQPFTPTTPAKEPAEPESLILDKSLDLEELIEYFSAENLL